MIIIVETKMDIIAIIIDTTRETLLGIYLMGPIALHERHRRHIINRHASHWGRNAERREKKRARRGYYWEDSWGDCYWIKLRHGRYNYDSVPRSYCW